MKMKALLSDQEIMDNQLVKERFDEMKTSNQLMLGELIILLDKAKNKDLSVVFDCSEYRPVSLDSWRGAYDELAINYSNEDPPLSCGQLLRECRKAVGTIFQGYKGGDFKMGKNTPLWVANYGTSSAWCNHSRAVVGVEERDDFISITTMKMEY